MEKITNKYEMSYIRKMGNHETHETENELIVLLPVGCCFAKGGNACSYCGYQALVDEMNATSTFDSYLEILKNELEKQTEIIHRISFFVGGSFFEIPESERLSLLQELNKYDDIKKVFFETRPELITEENVRSAFSALKNKELTVAIGLESSDASIRNAVHNKGFSNDEFEKKMKILSESGIKPFTYVFVKPPMAGITDEVALEDAIRSIKYSFDCGASGVELECGYIVEDSHMHELYKKGLYETLSLWNIKKLLHKAFALTPGIIRLAYFSDTPEPIAIPSNCEKCNDEFYRMFNQYRETMNRRIISNSIECVCGQSS